MRDWLAMNFWFLVSRIAYRRIAGGLWLRAFCRAVSLRNKLDGSASRLAALYADYLAIRNREA